MVGEILKWNRDLTKEVDENGWSPLHYAAYLGYASIARRSLLRSDSSVVYLRVKILDLLQGLQRESKDYEKDHYKNKTRKPINRKKPSLVSVTISLKQFNVSLVLREITSTSISQDTTADKQYLNT